jgi:Pilus assembly protein, PilO
MKSSKTLIIIMAILAIAIIPADILYASKFAARFKEIETQRIITSNQLATAKIVSENLDHVRGLVYKNMEFPGQKDSISKESILFDFLTTCVNDLKMKLVSIRPGAPSTKNRVTTYGYDIQLEGDYFSFGEFCSKIENSQRLLVVTAFEVIKAKSGEMTATTLNGGKLLNAASQNNKHGVTIKIHIDTFRVKKG